MSLIIGLFCMLLIMATTMAPMIMIIERLPRPTEAKTPEGFFWLICLEITAYGALCTVPMLLVVAFGVWWLG